MAVALVTGATGLVGRHCVSLLLDSPRYERVLVLARRATGLTSAKLDERIVDFEQLREFPAISVDDAFCALGTTLQQAGSWEAFRRVDHDYVLFTAQWALQAGATQFLLVSSVGAGKRSRGRYLRLKGEVEEQVSALPFRAVHIFRPSFLLGHGAVRARDEALIKMVAPLERLYFGPLRKLHSVAGASVAAAMLAAAAEATPGRHIYYYDEMVALEKPPIDRR